MLERVVSGGPDRGRSGRLAGGQCAGIDTGGRMPEGFMTEAGPRPDFTEMFGAVEMPGGGYPERTQANVCDSDATIWFGNSESPGGGRRGS
jgi:hypothetical protein